MKQYSISDVEELCGIKAHTLRIWERRYHFPSPIRTDTHIRKYTEEELKKILQVSSLVKAGYRISEVVKWPIKKVHKTLDEIYQSSKPTDDLKQHLINEMILATITFSNTRFENAYNKVIVKYGYIDTYTEIIIPLLQRIGILWSESELAPAQEHFTSNLIYHKICAAIEQLPEPDDTKDRWLLLLLEDEEHELGLLFARFLLKLHEIPTLYLRAKVPMKDLEDIKDTKLKLSAIHTFFIKNKSEEKVNTQIDWLRSCFPSIPLFISGNKEILSKIKPRQFVKIIHDTREFIQEIENYKGN